MMTTANARNVRVIPRRELLAFRAAFKLEIFKRLRDKFNLMKEREGFKQKDLAAALNMDEGQLSRILQGKNDMQVATFVDIARALECKVDVSLVNLVDIRAQAAHATERSMDFVNVQKVIYNLNGKTDKNAPSSQSNNVLVGSSAAHG